MRIEEAVRLPIMARVLVDDEPYVGRSLFVIPGQHGIFRRARREGRTGLKRGEGHVVAIHGETLVEFAPWTELDAIFEELYGGTRSTGDDPGV